MVNSRALFLWANQAFLNLIKPLRHQNEMITEYGLAPPIVSATMLVGLRCIGGIHHFKTIRGFDPMPTERGPSPQRRPLAASDGILGPRGHQ